MPDPGVAQLSLSSPEALAGPRHDEGVPEGYVSWSQLTTRADCGEKARLIYVQKVPRAPQGPLIAGSAIHKAIEWAEGDQIPKMAADGAGERARKLLEAKFLSIFRAAVEEAGGEAAIRWTGEKLITKTVEAKRFLTHLDAHAGQPWVPFRFRYLGKDDWAEVGDELNRLGALGDTERVLQILTTGSENVRWWESQGPVMLKRYLAVRENDLANGYQLLDGIVERRVLVNLPSGRPLLCYVDAALLVDADGTPVIRDWKSGAPGRAEPLQLGVYAWALQQATGVLPSRGQFVYLRTADSDRRIQSYDLDGYTAIVPEVFARHEALAATEVYTFSPSSFCSSCSVAEYCAIGRLRQAV